MKRKNRENEDVNLNMGPPFPGDTILHPGRVREEAAFQIASDCPCGLQDRISRRYAPPVAARKARAARRPRKPTVRAGKQVRFTAGLSLTRAESQRLEVNAAADLRSVSNYVSRLGSGSV